MSISIWLAHDAYDHNPNPYTISATALLRPTKQLILARRLPISSTDTIDIVNNIASRMGTAIHESLENAWINHYVSGLKLLGYDQTYIDRVKINPTSVDRYLHKHGMLDMVPIYLELRSSKKVGKWTVTGKFDFIADGVVEDLKTTKAYSYIKKSNDVKYAQQGSIYKWLKSRTCLTF